MRRNRTAGGAVPRLLSALLAVAVLTSTGAPGAWALPTDAPDPGPTRTSDAGSQPSLDEGTNSEDVVAEMPDTTEPAVADPAGEPVTAATDPAAAALSLVCEPGVVYSVAGDGAVVQIRDGATSRVGTWNRSSKQTNGLALGANGSVMYAYDRAGAGSAQNTALVLKYTPATEQWESIGARYSSGLNGNLIAGAVDLSNGHFLYGGYEAYGSGQTRFRLYEFDPATGTHHAKGWFPSGSKSQDGSNNGDIAFDAAGDLFVVRSDAKTVNLFSITAAELARSTGADYQMRATATARVTSDAGGVNGIAFDADGSILLGTESTIYRYNPTTWQRIGTLTKSLSNSTDLASCNSPSTVTIRKDIVDRKHAGDQFELTLDHVEGRSANRVADVTTTGTENGVQIDQIGPLPAVAGQSFTFGEAGAVGAKLDDYKASYTCTADGAPLTSGKGGMGQVTIPAPQAGQPGPSVECVITNAPMPDTTLTLRKAFTSKWGAPTTPETWTLTAQQTGSTTVDTYTSGDTHVVTAGTYRIAEHQQPGYALETIVCRTDDGAPMTLELDDRDGGTVEVPAAHSTDCTITNRDLPGEATWTKTDAATGQALAGSEWELRGPDGTTISVTDNDGDPQYGGWDRDPAAGGFRLDELRWGDYELVETRAPDGYRRLPGTAAAFTVGPDSFTEPTTLAFTIPNEEIVLGLEKYGYERGQADPVLIGGATFEIHPDRDGTPAVGAIDGAITPNADRGGAYTIRKVNPGSYWLVETRAPGGHTLLAAPARFDLEHDPDTGTVRVVVPDDGVLEASGDGLTLRLTDPRAVELPASGGNGVSPLYAGIGLAMLVIAAVWTFRSRRSRSTRRH